MHRAFFVVGVVVLAGCPSKDRARRADEYFAKLDGFVDRMCACKDRACGDKVGEDMIAYGTEMAKKERIDATEKQMAKMTEAETKFRDCQTKAMTSSKTDATRDFEAGYAKMSAFADRACACKDKPCADKIAEEMVAWSAALAKVDASERERPSEQQMQRLENLTSRYTQCLTKAMLTALQAVEE